MLILSIGRNTAFSLVRSGQIRSIRTGKQIRILKHDLRQFLEGGTGTETTWTDIGYPEARVLLPCCNPSIFVLKWGK